MFWKKISQKKLLWNNETMTDKNGYFRFDRSPQVLDDLVFIKGSFKTDTIPSVYSVAREMLKYNFVEKDTTIVIMSLKWEKKAGNIYYYSA